MRCRGGEAPGARFELHREQLRAHAGLAVRAEPRADPVGEGLHRGDIVIERRLLQHRRGHHQVAGEEVEAKGREFFGRATFCGGR